MKSSGKKAVNSGAKKRMTRRELLKYAAVAGPLLHAGMGLKATTSQPLPIRNVIVFLTDQERAIQHFPEGWESQNLPGLTRLKQSGVSFENAFTNACMCSPARSTLMSGYFPAQHGVKYTLEDNMTDPCVNPQVELPVNLNNVATVMSAAGFNVVYKGKWHCSKASTAADLPRTASSAGTRRTLALTKIQARREVGRPTYRRICRTTSGSCTALLTIRKARSTTLNQRLPNSSPSSWSCPS